MLEVRVETTVHTEKDYARTLRFVYGPNQTAIALRSELESMYMAACHAFSGIES